MSLMFEILPVSLCFRSAADVGGFFDNRTLLMVLVEGEGLGFDIGFLELWELRRGPVDT